MQKGYSCSEAIQIRQLAEFGSGESQSLQSPDVEDFKVNSDIYTLIVVTLTILSSHSITTVTTLYCSFIFNCIFYYKESMVRLRVNYFSLPTCTVLHFLTT